MTLEVGYPNLPPNGSIAISIEFVNPCASTAFVIAPAIFTTVPLKLNIGQPMQTEPIEALHVTYTNPIISDLATLDSICGTALVFTAKNDADGSVLDNGTATNTKIKFNTITNELEFESQEYSRAGEVLTGMTLEVGYPLLTPNGSVPISIEFANPCLTATISINSPAPFPPISEYNLRDVGFSIPWNKATLFTVDVPTCGDTIVQFFVDGAPITIG